MTLKRLLLLFSHHFRSFWIILAIGYFLIQQKNPFYFSYTHGNENRSKVNIISVPWFRQYPEDQPWNYWIANDESKTENLILEYMERLRIDSA